MAEYALVISLACLGILYLVTHIIRRDINGLYKRVLMLEGYERADWDSRAQRVEQLTNRLKEMS